AYEAGLLGQDILGTGVDVDLVIHAGAGAYICGEETALLDSLEGLRGQPRLRPPFPAVEGLYACPTVINNVESIASVPSIIREGTARLASLAARRGPPPCRPPFPAVDVLYACPTVINTVESIASVPSIIRVGKDWFASLGTEKSKGYVIYSLSGHVAKPGQYE